MSKSSCCQNKRSPLETFLAKARQRRASQFATVRCYELSKLDVQGKGVEPLYGAYETPALPLSYPGKQSPEGMPSGLSQSKFYSALKTFPSVSSSTKYLA